MKKYESIVSIHFNGDIVEDHKIPMRILGKSISSIQAAIDRAYLDIKHDGIWKHARMSQNDYPETEFFVQSPKKGGYIIDFTSNIINSKKILDRVSSAINQAILQTTEKIELLTDQIEARKLQIANRLIEPISFKDIFSKKNKAVIREYGDRSIAKEIDQVLSTIRSEYAGDSSLELTIKGESSNIFDFNKSKSLKFHGVVSRRNLSAPVIYYGKLQALDIRTYIGKFLNYDTGRISILHLNTEKDIKKVTPYLSAEKEIKFIGCPLIEFGSLEPNSGDIYFVDIASDNIAGVK